MQNKVKYVFSLLLGLFMIYGGVNHILKPLFYLPFVPNFFPFRETIVFLSGLLEILVGVGLFIPLFRQWSAWIVLAMMLAFLPIHIWDIFRSDPAIGSHAAALIRAPFQLIFIAWSAWIACPCKKCMKTTH